MATPMVTTAACPNTRNQQHIFDWAASDSADLVSYARGTDRAAVVRLSRCQSCGSGLIGICSVDSPDADPGVVLTVLGLEVS